MNIEILQEHIDTFNKEIVESGFKRDLDDYISSLPSAQNNIIAMRDMAEKALSSLDDLFDSDLPDALEALLPPKKPKPFTEVPHNDNLRGLLENTEIQQPELFNQLTQFLNKLQKQIQQNLAEITKIEEFFTPYIAENVNRMAAENYAVIAIIFKDHITITNLNHFTKTLTTWNKILPIYHQLLKSESPEDIHIAEIQNGSIDVVVNLNVDVAFNLAELFKVGFHVFAAYLSYKKMIKPIIDSYHGNKKLISQEGDREKLMLENIGSAIHQQAEEQHKKAKNADNKIDGTAIKKKVEQVTKLIASHIVKGNDLKLLTLPDAGEDKEKGQRYSDEKNDLLKQSITAMKKFKEIPTEDRKLLLETYDNNDEESNVVK